MKRFPTWDVEIDELQVTIGRKQPGLTITYRGRAAARDENEARKLVARELTRAGITIPYGAIVRVVPSVARLGTGENVIRFPAGARKVR